MSNNDVIAIVPCRQCHRPVGVRFNSVAESLHVDFSKVVCEECGEFQAEFEAEERRRNGPEEE